MKIKKLTINSFRGLKNMEFNLQEKLNVFEGKNELGKTSVVDSVLWVLAGDTLVYGKQDSDNRNEHNLKDVINVILEMDNGLVLERKYFDVWKEDSDGNLKFSRTENQFFINGAKYKVQEYFDFIKESIGLKTIIKPKEINLLRALIDYNYLSSIDYKITREFYEGVLGLQSDLELLSQEKYGLIATDMQALRCDIGKCKHKYATALKEIEKEIETTNSILQMKEKSIDSEKLENYDRYIGERMELLKTNVNEESEYLRLNKELEQNSINIQEEQKNVLEALNHATELRSEYIQKGNEVKNQFIALENLVKSNNEKIEFHREKGINHYERLIEQERSSVFKSVNCPHCGKSLNDNDKSVYERNKKELINNYQREIEKTKETINVLTKSTTSANDKCKKLEEEFNVLQNQYNDNELRIKELNEEKQSNTKVNELLLEKERLTNELNLFINNYNNSKLEKVSQLDEKIAESSVIQQNYKDLEIYRNALKQLRVNRAKLETQKDLVEEFKREKIQMLKENTSKVFPNIEIELIEVNENTESTKDVCYAKFKDVKYSGMNDGNKKLLGITIIENIRTALGLKELPIVFDKFADIDTTNLQKILNTTNCQILATFVSEKDNITIKGE